MIAAEVETAVELIKTLSFYRSTTRIISISLREPEKSCVYEWNESDSIPRHAEATLFDNAANRASIAKLDISERRILSWHEAPPGAQLPALQGRRGPGHVHVLALTISAARGEACVVVCNGH